MNHFNRLPEFEKEIKRLSKKFRSLEDDLRTLEKVLITEPYGIGSNFVTVFKNEDVAIIKSRLACRSLQGTRAMRIIYAYHETTISFVYIEIYHKGEKQNENRDRYQTYGNKFKKDK